MTLYLLLSLVSANSAFSAAVLRYNGVQQAPKKMLCFIAESSVFCRKIIYNDTIYLQESLITSRSRIKTQEMVTQEPLPQTGEDKDSETDKSF